MQYFLAAHGLKLAACGGAVILAVVVGWACGGFSFWSVIAVFLAVPMGSVLGLLFLSPLIGAVVSKINGAPFHLGDAVRILVGPYRDRVGYIYAMWIERNQVRVELNEQAKNDVTDVFGYNEICRERKSNPHVGAKGGRTQCE